jgi:hypothetical protein
MDVVVFGLGGLIHHGVKKFRSPSSYRSYDKYFKFMSRVESRKQFTESICIP